MQEFSSIANYTMHGSLMGIHCGRHYTLTVNKAGIYTVEVSNAEGYQEREPLRLWFR
jgi:hypothetical protein